jgi:hypothetical protein
MISCNKCGFSHLTWEEHSTCRDWAESVAECAASNHPIIRRDWHFGEYEYCVCGKKRELRVQTKKADSL